MSALRVGWDGMLGSVGEALPVFALAAVLHIDAPEERPRLPLLGPGPLELFGRGAGAPTPTPKLPIAPPLKEARGAWPLLYATDGECPWPP